MPTSAAPATVTEGPREVELKLELDHGMPPGWAETSLVRGARAR